MNIINEIVVLMFLALIGYFAGRTGYLPEKSGMYISRLVIKITAPALIVTTMAAYDFTAKTITDGIWVSFFAVIFIAFSFAVGSVFCRLLRLESAASSIFKTHLMFGNVGYLALPLFKSIFGEKGLVYAVFFVIAHDTLVWTVGVYLMNKHNGKQWKENLKHLINANMISFVLGLFFALVNLQHFVSQNTIFKAVYMTLFNTLNPLGNTTLYLMMLFIGLTLAENRIGSLSDLLKKYPTFILAFLKLLVIPAVAFVILYLLGDIVDPFVRVIVILELAMPCALIVPALAAQYGSDYKLATDNVILTTLFSMATLPLTLYLLSITAR